MTASNGRTIDQEAIVAARILADRLADHALRRSWPELLHDVRRAPDVDRVTARAVLQGRAERHLDAGEWDVEALTASAAVSLAITSCWVDERRGASFPPTP